jgi:tryptophan-rich sensory protein
VRASSKTMSISRNLLGLVAWLALSFFAAAVGGLASVDAPTFYGQLVRPSWAPPGWLFGPVWSVLYLLMGVAAWLVWSRAGFAAARAALILFVIQLVANALWSWLFFVWHLGAAAFVEVLVLWLLIVATIGAFWRVRRLAAVLLLPYLGWVSFAAALTFAVWRRNPGLLG